MSRHLSCTVLLVLLAITASCNSAPRHTGKLLLVGGGLDNDARSVYSLLLAAPARGETRVVIATAATGPQEVEATDKREALLAWAPSANVEIMRRETSTEDTVALLSRASAVFFTGGDQKRITARYWPGDTPGPEWSAMQDLLARGGVLGGGSAGCAMLGERMLEGGRSARALGIRDPADDASDGAQFGPQVGRGMGFLRGVVTDSHFFERDRVGRLVAALLEGPDRFGLGVGEDAALLVDPLAREAIGLTIAESLWIDATFARRTPIGIVGLRARLIGHGEKVPLAPLGETAPAEMGPSPTIAHEIQVVEPGQNRQLGSWRVFRRAVPGAGVTRLQLDGWSVWTVAESADVIVFEVRIDAASP